MAGYELSPESLADLEEIWNFVAADQPAMADRVVDELFETFDRLASWPGAGHFRPDLTDAQVRFWPVRPYLIVYRERADKIQIVAILHGSRDVTAILEGRQPTIGK
jgi:toxin ParE1/3/4